MSRNDWVRFVSALLFMWCIVIFISANAIEAIALSDSRFIITIDIIIITRTQNLYIVYSFRDENHNITL